MLTQKDFQNCYYSIGGGFDLQPLLRLTHLVDQYLYVNLYLEMDEVEKWYDEAFQMFDFEVLEKQIHQDFDETKHFEIDHANLRRNLFHSNFLSREEFAEYTGEFSPALDLPQYAIEYRVRRSSLGREFRFVFCTAEGLASYLALSDNGRIAPRILSTIQTGPLELALGILNRFFSREDVVKPDMWIRGHEPTLHPPLFINGDPVLQNAGVFSVPAMSFIGTWRTGFSYQSQHTDVRLCRGYMTPFKQQQIKETMVLEGFLSENQRHSFTHQKFDFAIPKSKKSQFIVCSRSIAEKNKKPKCRIIYWEDFAFHIREKEMMPADQQIRNLKTWLKTNEVPINATLFIIPYCLEDQGQLYAQTIQELDQKTHTYLSNAHDFIGIG